MNARRAPARRLSGWRRWTLALALVAIGTLRPAVACADSTEPVYPEYQGYVTDTAHVLGDETRAKLEAFLDQVEKKTGAEFAVLTVPSSAPLDPTEYKVRVFERWKLGKKGKDNGLLMLVSMEEHAIRFETGYGLEGALPDMVESRIVRERMVPLMRARDVDGAVTQGVLAAAARIAHESNVTLEWDGRELRYDGGSARAGRFPATWIAFLMFFLIASVLRFAGRRRRGWYIGPGGWGGGFGGYSGGSGGFGGGGSFGGFGGGSSGGGGGGGSW